MKPSYRITVNDLARTLRRLRLDVLEDIAARPMKGAKDATRSRREHADRSVEPVEGGRR